VDTSSAVPGAAGLGIADVAPLAALITEPPAHWRDFGSGGVLTVLKPMAGGTPDTSDFC